MSTTQVKNGWHGGTDDQLLVNPDGSINVNSTGTAVITGDVNINGLNAFISAQYVVGTTAIQIVIPSGTSSVGIKTITTSSRDAVLVGNTSGVTNAIDGTGNGYFLFNGDAVQIDLTAAASLYVIGTSAGQIICVIFAGG